MRTYVYRAVLEVGENPDVLVVSFPDVPEAITEGKDRADALAQAADALGLVLLEYLRRGRPLPQARSRKGVPVPVDAQDAAKLAVVEAFAASGITKTELARRLGIRESEARQAAPSLRSACGARSEVGDRRRGNCSLNSNSRSVNRRQRTSDEVPV
jgi:antitoxin HicB